MARKTKAKAVILNTGRVIDYSPLGDCLKPRGDKCEINEYLPEVVCTRPPEYVWGYGSLIEVCGLHAKLDPCASPQREAGLLRLRAAMQQRLAGTETKVADGTEDAPWGGSPEDGAPKQIAAEKCATEAESLAWGSMEIHGFGELSEYHLTALIKFCTAFDFRFTVRAETEPEENRQGLRLPPVGGVVVTLYQSEPA